MIGVFCFSGFLFFGKYGRLRLGSQKVFFTNATRGGVNFAMVEAYWLIGQQIVEEEQQGAYRVEYGKNLLAYLSDSLKEDLGKGFDQTNLSNTRKFDISMPILDALRQELAWISYRCLL